MESESGTANTKISDSGYSNSCGNSHSQSSASSKSRNSGSNSSLSSGYCGAPTVNGSATNTTQPKKRSLDYRNKPAKAAVAATNTTLLNENSEPLQVPDNILESSVNSLDDKVVTELKNINVDHDFNNENILAHNSCNEAQQEDLFNVWKQTQDSSEDKEEIDEISYADIRDTPIESTGDVHHHQPENGFFCVISMANGVVLYTTSTLTSVLGFPRDMWLGRSFLDFVHPKDRETFSEQITNGIALPLVEYPEKNKDICNKFFVFLRKYRGLKTSGFSITEKVVAYEAFQLNISLKVMKNQEDRDKFGGNGMYLVVAATPVVSSYKVPDETRNSSKFGMRHTAACKFSHVDPDVVKNFGFLPQDMLGKSIFDFYHPDDMPFLKEVYESVMLMCQVAGSVFRSKPYRFAVQNGDFAIVETEWSSFVNPWSRRIEFVIGLHRVLQGPTNPNIFDVRKAENKSISEEVLKESKIIQEEIIVLLNKELCKPNKVAKQEVSKCCKDLATFMENLMEEVYKSNMEVDLQANSNLTISERDSVMLGEISPHHDYYDSKSSSETPPSYNQLNYNENIQRFFQSKPKTTKSDGSGDRHNGLINNDSEETKCPAMQDCQNNQKCLSPFQTSGASGSGSAGNLSSNRNPIIESDTTSATNLNDSYKPPHLTEELLCKHNKDMEKMMAKIHRDKRTSIKADRENKKSNHNYKSQNKRKESHNNSHGVKRSGSNSWDINIHKVSKHKHQNNFNNLNEASPVNKSKQNSATSNDNIFSHRPNEVNLWPPFSVAMTPMNSSLPCGINTVPTQPATFATGMIPVYYISSQPGLGKENLDPVHSALQVQYISGMVYNYNPIIPIPPIFCSPLPVMPLTIPQSTVVQENQMMVNNQSKITSPNTDATPQFQRPASQGTSVKAGPGSIMSSVASASVANKSPKNTPQNFGKYNSQAFQYTEEESSFSSYYSSFLKTDTGSGSNDDCNEVKKKENWRSRTTRKRDPPWLEAVSITTDLIYQYQMSLKGVEDILESDLKTLKGTMQPLMVNDQLSQLYVEMQLEGLSTKLTLEEGFTSSGSSADESHLQNIKPKKGKSYSSKMMIYEENAPFPPPNSQ